MLNPLDAMLGTTTKVRVLRALLQVGGPVSGREARRLSRVRSADSLASALEELTALGILSRDETRGSHLYRINREHDLFEPLAGLFDTETHRVNRLRNWLGDALSAASLEARVLSLMLYGSNARADATPGSDLDLLVVTSGEDSVSAVRAALLARADELIARMGLSISPYVLSREQFELRREGGDPLFRTIADEGRVLLGDPVIEAGERW